MNDDPLIRVKQRLPSLAERRTTFGLKIVALCAFVVYLSQALVAFLGAIQAVGMLVVGAIFLAYLIGPLVARLSRHVPRSLALAIVYVIGFLVVVLAGVLLLPALATDVAAFAQSLPSLVMRLHDELLSPSLPFVDRIPLDDRVYLADLPSQFGTLVKTYGLDTLERSFAVVRSAFSLIGALVIVPVLAAYMLLDAGTIRAHVRDLFPPRLHPRIEALIDDLNGAIGGFLRGQLIDGAIVGAMIFALLLIAQVPYALLIGVCAGILNFIPYAGAVIGFVPAVLLAFAYHGPTSALIVAIAFAIIQQLDGNLIAPRVLKDSVGLSPVYIMLAILVGSALFGLAGTFLAVPVAAMLRVLREHFIPVAIASTPDA
jgi:predicted PurR-regulated permease PerM